MPTVLVVGATRGLGLSLVKQYAAAKHTVYGTARSEAPKEPSPDIKWIRGVDVSKEDAGSTLATALKVHSLNTVIITAGYFGTESLDQPNFKQELLMYKTSSIGPVFIVHHLHKAGLLTKGSKIILVSSESGSITLRHESEGGGNYGHHASKAALNMVGKLLSLDLKEHGVAVAIVHPGFMRTEMTKGVGFDKYWDAGGAVKPDEAAQSLIKFINDFDISRTGEYWAPRGPADIGTAEAVLGPKDKLPTPLQLPW
ncbi:hypothetical protein LTR66_002174 [Elasticomyces elasticus]|nr:hypothetical protein LTR66_002174 [Elasticomyces elasticus]